MLKQRHGDWSHGTLEDAHTSDRADKPSMSLRELSDALHRSGHYQPGSMPDPTSMEHALQDLSGRGHVEPAPMAGEWQYRARQRTGAAAVAAG